MAKDLLVKTVETNTQRKSRRATGEIPYPIKYTNQMADFDIWDHKFLANYFGGLTNHHFQDPPQMVLDLGCGTGYWAIEAAQQWPNSKIYGYDVANVQPCLEHMGKFKPLSRRIQWVHGNFLDGLPFPSNHFDLIRMAGLGLAIPEDECTVLLEDVHRILKPDGVLEIIEEELLFPCSSILLQRPSHQTSPVFPMTGHLPIFDLYKNKSTASYEHIIGPRTRALSLATSLDSLTESMHLKFKPPSKISLTHPSTGISSAATLATSSASSFLETEHPQDHTRLKMAWDAMLAMRFLSPKLLSVIPFYLTSASFNHIKTQPSLVIPLPQNSGIIPVVDVYRPTGSFHGNESQKSLVTECLPMSKSEWTPPRSPGFTPKVASSDWSMMHLGKTVSTIRGCKEAIWKEYEKLYSDDALYLLSRTAPGEEDYSLQQPHHIARKSFEVDWRNWEL
uniref:Methyltransferase domain-containing protein n=1 Tax=Psilocybe cubensis TaxID=181762 RepID=A0A8H7Y0J2_PSICU